MPGGVGGAELIGSPLSRFLGVAAFGGRAVVLRIEPLRVSPHSGCWPRRQSRYLLSTVLS